MKDLYARKDLFQDAIKHFTGVGYSHTSHTSLISKSFPDTYNPSGGHDKVTKLISSPNPVSNFHREIFVDICFRHIDLPRIGLGRHASIFEMLTYIDAASENNLDRHFVLETTIRFLTDLLGFEIAELYFSTFGGWKSKQNNFTPDNETIETLQTIGIPRPNIFPVPGPSNFVYTTSNGDAAGPRTEIFLKNSIFSIPLELGTVVFENHFFSKGQIRKSINRVFGGAFGIERLLMALNGSLIDDIEPNTILSNVIFNMLKNDITHHNSPLIREHIYKTVDYTKALVFICLNGGRPSRRGRGQRLKKIISLLNKTTLSLGLKSSDVLATLFPYISNIYSDSYPDLFLPASNCLNRVFDPLNIEFE